jgi:tRNA 2-thiouridine synthesizing protein B
MLHIINKSPYTNSALDACLRVAQGGDILLIEDAVYAAVGGAAEKRVRDAMKQFKFHVLQADLEARGIADRVIDGVHKVDYGGFVELAAKNKNCQSWL